MSPKQRTPKTDARQSMSMTCYDYDDQFRDTPFIYRDGGISIVIATRNEEETINSVIGEFARASRNLGAKVQGVIADSSTDNTVQEAEAASREHGFDLVCVRIPTLGRGLAVKKGVEKADYDTLCFADADGSHDAEAFIRMARAFRKGTIVAASRFPPFGSSEEHTFFRYYGNVMLATLVSILFRIRVTDVTNCFVIMDKRTFYRLDLNSNGWSFDVQLVCHAAKLGIPFIEVPFCERKRRGGVGKFHLMDGFQLLFRVILERLTP